MRAIVYDEYGPPDVLAPREIEKPALTDDGVLVRVHSSSVNFVDWHMLTGRDPVRRSPGGRAAAAEE